MQERSLPRVVIMGMGYIGLPTAAVVARAGMAVLGVDIIDDVVATINGGRVHIEETDLEALVAEVVTAGQLRAATRPEPGDVFVIAVPTPVASNNSPDVSLVLNATRAIAPVLDRGNMVIVESTSPVGTTDQVCALLAELRPDLRMPESDGSDADVHIAYCPERVLPGQILRELIENERSIGGITPTCAQAARTFYERFVRAPCTVTTARIAEMVKLSENTFRDVNIAFANELSLLAETLDVDVWEVIRLANRHPRVNILQPGPGVGGHCIAVDPWFLVASDPERARLIRTAREVNLAKTEHVLHRARTLVAAQPEARVAVFGLAFKPNVDDFRESPALYIARALATDFGGRIRVVEPFATELPEAIAETGARMLGAEAALAECAILILLVDHDAFRAIGPDDLAGHEIYDTRGVW